MSLNGPTDLARFASFAAIDWSGQAVARPAGLAVALAAAGDAAPQLIVPPGGWSRPAIVEWLSELAQSGSRTLIGLDLSPALPFVDQEAYFPGWDASPQNGPALWALVDHLTQEDPHLASTSFLAHPEARRHFRQSGDCGDLFGRGRGRLRVCEEVQRRMAFSPYSCFNLVGAAQVGKSSLTGMRVLHRLRGRIPVWPFDPIPETGPLIVEIYTTIAARAAGIRAGLSKIRDGDTLDGALMALDSQPHTPLARYNDHATDAILTAAWLRRAAPDPSLWSPPALTLDIAQTEGWTFGCI